MEIGITGGEEDGVDNSGMDQNKLYTQPEQVRLSFLPPRTKDIDHVSCVGCTAFISAVHQGFQMLMLVWLLSSSVINLAATIRVVFGVLCYANWSFAPCTISAAFPGLVRRCSGRVWVLENFPC